MTMATIPPNMGTTVLSMMSLGLLMSIKVSAAAEATQLDAVPCTALLGESSFYFLFFYFFA